jgi:hypothetical protein
MPTGVYLRPRCKRSVYDATVVTDTSLRFINNRVLVEPIIAVRQVTDTRGDGSVLEALAWMTDYSGRFTTGDHIRLYAALIEEEAEIADGSDPNGPYKWRLYRPLSVLVRLPGETQRALSISLTGGRCDELVNASAIPKSLLHKLATSRVSYISYDEKRKLESGLDRLTKTTLHNDILDKMKTAPSLVALRRLEHEAHAARVYDQLIASTFHSQMKREPIATELRARTNRKQA